MDYQRGVDTDVLVADFIHNHGRPQQDLEPVEDVHTSTTNAGDFLGEESTSHILDSSVERRPTSELFEKLHSRVSDFCPRTCQFG